MFFWVPYKVVDLQRGHHLENYPKVALRVSYFRAVLGVGLRVLRGSGSERFGTGRLEILFGG